MMKRLLTGLTVLAALSAFGAAASEAADTHFGYPSHGQYAHSYPAHGYGYGYGYGGGHGQSHADYGYGSYRQGYLGHGGYSVHGLSPYGHGATYAGHGGGIRIATPHFGLRIGH